METAPNIEMAAKRYVEAHGLLCPFCAGSGVVVTGPSQTWAEGTDEPMACAGCKGQWYRSYDPAGALIDWSWNFG
jgi:hypothetical protein